MPDKSPSPVIRFLHRIEDGILILMLMVMIFMAVLQIVLRNLFDSGILWGDGLVRILVLWIGLVGAMIASRNNHHISIDVVSRFLPPHLKRVSSLVISLFTMGICWVMAYFSFTFVLLEKEDGMTAFAAFPVWICESIIPVTFGIIGFRYMILSFQTLIILFKRPSQ